MLFEAPHAVAGHGHSGRRLLPTPARSSSQVRSLASGTIGWVSGCTNPTSPRKRPSGSSSQAEATGRHEPRVGHVCDLPEPFPVGQQGHRPGGPHLNELYGLVKDFDPREIAVAFDLGHPIIVHKDQWPVQYARLAPHIRVVCVKDVQRPSRFVPFGQGEFARSGFFLLQQGRTIVPRCRCTWNTDGLQGPEDTSRLRGGPQEDRRIAGPVVDGRMNAPNDLQQMSPVSSPSPRSRFEYRRQCQTKSGG